MAALPSLSCYFGLSGRKSWEKLLDIACGTGYLLKTAEKKHLRTFGINISAKGVQIAQENASNSDISVGRSENLYFPDSIFDYVTCLGALEHFLDKEKSIKEMKRVAKKDATFCVMVPNINYLFWKIKGSKGTEQQQINEHLLSLTDWKNFFVNNGFNILEIHQDRWFTKRTKLFSTFKPWEIAKRSLYKLAWVFLPLQYTYQFIFILKKQG